MSANASDKPSHLYLSPHLDDVPFSCAGLIARQRAQDQRVVVVTYFTADSDTELSALAQRFHVVWDRGPKPYASRRTEDKAAMELLKVEFNHEGMHDAIYRLDESSKPLYPTMDRLFGSVRSDDFKTIESIAVSIKRWIEALDPSFLYIPVGISRSVDHQVVILAAKRALEDSRIALKLYEEFPYATGCFPKERPMSVDQGLAESGWLPAYPEISQVDLAARVAAARCYPSQIAEIFGDEQAMLDQLRDYLYLVGEGVPAERYWTPLCRSLAPPHPLQTPAKTETSTQTAPGAETPPQGYG
jgi:LmbE family N-acetylglucosaminyl deacetylase